MLSNEFDVCKGELHKTCFQVDPMRRIPYETLEFILDSFPNPSENLYGLLETRFNLVLDAIRDNLDEDKARKVIARAINVVQLYWKYSGGSLHHLEDDRSKVAEGKREDYTKGDEDVLKNFKNQAESFGIDPKVSLGVHMEKQMSAVLNYIKTDGESESEPIIKRVGDTLNYLELLYGLFVESKPKENPRQSKMAAICSKCQCDFDTPEQRERECTAPDFTCPHK